MKPIVSVEQGRLLGKTSSNIKGGLFYCFQGIPYAKPPLGDLRFKPPQPPCSWSGVLNATKEGNECYARHLLNKNKFIGSENCLFLNVYTPTIVKDEDFGKVLKPVMVWIHGGAFMRGSGNSDIHGPEYLLTQDVVLVTINYRLGLFGFLKLKDPSLGVPGNACFKDMIMALKWVQRNIKVFGGNPNNVTLFGTSIGAASVHLMVLSASTKGLFHKAIMQSGCALNPFARARDDLPQLVASVLKLGAASEREILNHLRQLSTDKIYLLSEKLYKMWHPYYNTGKLIVFSAVLEETSNHAFLTEEPIKIIQSGNYNKVPMIFGYNSAEGMLFNETSKIISDKFTPYINFESIIPFWLDLEVGSKESLSLADKIKNFYFGGANSGYKIESFYNLYTDCSFLRDILCAVFNHVTTSNYPIFVYRMSVETSLNYYKIASKIKTPGAAHCDELGYLFKAEDSPEIKPGSLEEKSINRFVKLWTNFAQHGHPNHQDELPRMEWLPFKINQINILDIGKTLSMGNFPESDRIKFWNRISRIKPAFTWSIPNGHL